MADWRMFVQTLKKFIHAPWESSSKFAPWSVSVYGLNRVCPSAYAILLRVRTDGAEGDFFLSEVANGRTAPASEAASPQVATRPSHSRFSPPSRPTVPARATP
jgi:hypothetical protein